MHGLSDVNINELFTMVENDSITRTHSKKVHKQCTRLDCSKYFYCQRVITSWNNLSQKTVIAEPVCFEELSGRFITDKLLN